MDSAVNGMPITKVEGTCKNYNTSLVLGDYVSVVEDESYTFDEIKYTKYLIRFK